VTVQLSDTIANMVRYVRFTDTAGPLIPSHVSSSKQILRKTLLAWDFSKTANWLCLKATDWNHQLGPVKLQGCFSKKRLIVSERNWDWSNQCVHKNPKFNCSQTRVPSVLSCRLLRSCSSLFFKLRHLWRRRDDSLSVKGRVYSAAVCPILLYGSETWPLRA